MMTEKTKKKKRKGFISEEDVSVVLQRYTANTIIALLQEVAQSADVKIDWNALVKKTTTGISNAREYQMLWRHLAYRDAFAEKFEDGAEPLDDDSDLEYELEASPHVSNEASTEAAACVKVLLASGLSSDSGIGNNSTVEAPLILNIPNGQTPRASAENPQTTCSTQGTNITVPVSVQKQSLPTVATAEGLDTNGSAGGTLPPRKKRKLWTAEEDMELIAAVQKCGEGNWANILKGDFKGDRTASQLSQRWAIIRKRQPNLNVGGVANSTSSQLSEAQLAARRAVSIALNMPMMDNLTATSSVAAASTIAPIASSFSTAPAEASPVSGRSSETNKISAVGSSLPQALNQSQNGLTPPNTSSRIATSSTSQKSRTMTKKASSVPVKSSMGPNPFIQAAAVAAGARIVTPSTAASLLMAAQSKNAVHIRPGGGSLIKTSMSGGTKPMGTNHTGPRANVHYIRTSLATPTPPITYSTAVPTVVQEGSSQQSNGSSLRPGAPTGQLYPTSVASSLIKPAASSALSPYGTVEEKDDDTAALCVEDLPKEDIKPSAETKENGCDHVPQEHVRDDIVALQNSEGASEIQTAVLDNLGSTSNMEAGENNQKPMIEETALGGNMTGEPVCPAAKGVGEYPSMIEEMHQNEGLSDEKTDMQSMTADGVGVNQTSLTTELIRNEKLEKLASDKETD